MSRRGNRRRAGGASPLDRLFALLDASGRLSRRGRFTLAAGLCGFGLVLGFSSAPWLVRPSSTSPQRAATSAPGAAVRERVDAAPPPQGIAHALAGSTQRAPAHLFERLPVGRGNGVFDLDAALGSGPTSGVAFASSAGDPSAGSRMVELVPVPDAHSELAGPLRVEYSLDSELRHRILKALRIARVRRGHVIVLDPRSGRVLAYVSTDPERFPPSRAYPAASLVKVVTAAAALEADPAEALRPCRFRGSPYRLTRSRLQPPRRGREISLEGALATSNNQCFAQMAVNTIGERTLLDTLGRFGWLDSPAPGHDSGRVETGSDDYALGRLGCGLSGCRITPLHAARLAATLATGHDIEPWWVDRVVDAGGRELALPERAAPRRVMSQRVSDELRRMMVRTTTRGTARSAFRDRRGRPKLGTIRVSGKTGNLSGREPKGRYEWFIGVAPAEDPSIAVAVVQVHGNLWWSKSSEVAAEVLQEVFCEGRRCAPELAHRFTGELGIEVAPVFLSDSGT